jgi:hypothetical protein
MGETAGADTDYPDFHPAIPDPGKLSNQRPGIRIQGISSKHKNL